MTDDPARLIAALLEHGLEIAVAESLTGGALTARLVDVPGSSAVVRGGVVSYATDLKAAILGVDPERLAVTGPVDPEVARQMAEGARRVLGSGRPTLGVATTGVAGPDPQGGREVGTVYIAVVGPGIDRVHEHRFAGDRAAVRAAAVSAALDACMSSLREQPSEEGDGPTHTGNGNGFGPVTSEVVHKQTPVTRH